jgi:hypothetical protein
LRRTLLEKNRQKNKSKTITQIKEEESLFESMDEIQELLKIFYKFFVGERNKAKPSTEDNQMKYYKNKYYQPELYRQDLTVDVNEQVRALNSTHTRNISKESSSSIRRRKVAQPPTKINEDSDEEEVHEEIVSVKDQDEDMFYHEGDDDAHDELERRMSMLQDEDHELSPAERRLSKKNDGLPEFKKLDIYNTTAATQGPDHDEKFQLNASAKDVFNKRPSI